MKKLIIISILALFTLNSFSQTILKKIDIDIPAIEQTARVAEITFIAKDKSYIRCNLYRSAQRNVIEAGEIDGVTTPAYGAWQPVQILAKNRVFSQADAVDLLGLTNTDYLKFYPVVIVLTDKQIKDARIEALETEIEKLTKELNELKG